MLWWRWWWSGSRCCCSRGRWRAVECGVASWETRVGWVRFRAWSGCLLFRGALSLFGFAAISTGTGSSPARARSFAIRRWTIIFRFRAWPRLFFLGFLTLLLYVGARCVRLLIFASGSAHQLAFGFTISSSSLPLTSIEWLLALLSIILTLSIFLSSPCLPSPASASRIPRLPASWLFPSR